MKINIVYHCFLVGNWRKIVHQQIERLNQSGLYDFANRIIVTVNLEKENIEELKQLLSSYPKLEFEFSKENHAEYLGIKKVRELAMLEDCYILYFHSKGVSNVYENYIDKNYSEEKVKNIASWKECLEYFLIDRWKECIDLLSYNDNVGVTCNRSWYWGNFWWTKTSHVVKTIPVGVWSRWEYEAWLNRNISDSKNFEWFHFNFNPYLTFIHEDWYKNTNTVPGKINLKRAYYGTPEFHIDEGYIGVNLNVGKDVTGYVQNLLSESKFSKFDFVIDNENFGGDPIPGAKKFLILDFSLESNPSKTYRIGVDEGQRFTFEIFDKETIYQSKIVFAVVSSKKFNHNNLVVIDRIDLTRKLDCINTWVEDALFSGMEVVFLEGDSPSEIYNPESMTLSLPIDDRYEEHNKPSRLFDKVVEGLKWILQNKNFDFIYVCDDDIFINVEEFKKMKIEFDYMSNGALGGSGFFFSRAGAEYLIRQKNEGFSSADVGIHSYMMSAEGLKKNNGIVGFCPQYFPGELYSTIHYVTGKRSYFVDSVLKNYKENKVTNRKIILFYPLDSHQDNPVISYESNANKKTKRWYDFTKDPNGWEYHGGYTRSSIDIPNLKSFWPYAERATKYFILNYDVIKTDLNFMVENCEKSLIDPENVFLISESQNYVDGWIIDNSLKEKLLLTFENLKNYNLYKKNKL